MVIGISVGQDEQGSSIPRLIDKGKVTPEVS